ncbi:unnamed protein product [Oreochromis niloticus]|nr:unnamed protein product [Mustela putorius furo]
MAAAQKHVLHVYVERDTTLKLTLLERPKSVEELKEIIQERFKPRLNGDFSLHYVLMDTTYALCRQEIVGAVGAPRVRDIVDRWPALLMESQVKK